MLKSYYSIILFIFLSTISFGQTNFEIKSDPFSNSVILKHYSESQLQQIQGTDSVRFKTIVYYYTQSFILEKIDCFDCIEVNISKFDISKYEHLRKPHDRYIREVDKYGIKITILSADELLYKMPIHLQ